MGRAADPDPGRKRFGTAVTPEKLRTYLNVDEVARRGSRKAESFREVRKDPKHLIRLVPAEGCGANVLSAARPEARDREAHAVARY